ncbi:hypothetical protein AA0473_0446 [Acetobacter orleanensis NRIC 0473]|nr:hypothetical protein AA0473_0446 [Acetobacter orleanensis NRIC 0473]
MLEKSIDSFRQTLGPDASLTYKKAWPGLLGRSVKFTALVFRQGQQTITADDAEISKVSTAGDETKRIGHLTFHTFQFTDTSGNVRLDNLALEDVTLPGNGDDKHGTPPQTLEIGHVSAGKLHGFIASLQSDITASSLTLDNYGIGEASHLDARDLRLATSVAPQRQIAAKSLLLDGVDLAGLYNSVTYNTPYKPLNGVRDIQVEALSIDSTSPLLRVAKLSSHATHSDASEQEVSSLQGLELWPAVPSLSLLPTLGYDHFRGSLVLNVTHDYKSNKLHVDTFSIEAPDMGRLTLDGDFSETTTLAMLSAGAAEMQVLSMNLSYKDHGLVSKVLENLARTRGMTPQDFTASLQSSLVPQGSAPNAPMPQLANYLAHPGNGPLTLTLRPQQPVPLMAIAASLSMLPSAPQIAQQIGLTIKAP